MPEIDRHQHGIDRAGKVGASVAHIIDTGRTKGWMGLAKRLWADTGEEFAAETGGARQYGHEHEDEGAAKFWERHPELTLEKVGWMPYDGLVPEFIGTVGCSPDRLIHDAAGKLVGGLEIKSPTREDTVDAHSAAVHRAQCGHSMMVLNMDSWYLVVHHGDVYRETLIKRDYVWEARYIMRLRAFIQLMQYGHFQPRKKLSIKDL